MLLSLQTNIIFTLTIIYGNAVKPPGYVQPAKAPDPNPPKYEYEYKISDEQGSGQGKQEQRDGIYALGRYYVQGKNSNQDVQYFADDWGYHPVVEYSSVGPHSRATTQFALGTEAVQQLKNKENNRPQLQGIFNGNERLDNVNNGPANQNTPSSTESKQAFLQPQNQVVTQPQLQLQLQPQQSQEITISSQIQKEPVGDTSIPAQDGVSQPVLLVGEYQQQPLDVRLSEIQTVNEQGNSQEQSDIQSQLEVQTISQNSLDNQASSGEGQSEYQQQSQHAFTEQNQQIQQIEVTSQSQRNHNEQQQGHQVILEHQEPIQKLIFPQEQQQQQQVYLSQNSNDNTGLNQQLVYVQLQPQQGEFIQQPQHTQFNSQTEQVHNQESFSSQQNQEKLQNNQHESETIFENLKSQLISAEKLISDKSYQNEDESISLENYDEFGSKIAVKNVADTSNRLIEHTKNLVTGKDVININEAITQDHNVILESSSPQSLVTEYDTSRVESQNTVTNVLINHSDVSSYSTTTTSPTTESSLKEQPIVVADIEENTYQSTAKSVEVVHNSQEKFESSTSTIQDGVVSNHLDTTPPSTVLVTPRPVSSNFLAPITAGVQLQNIEIQNEDRKNVDTQHYKVEIQQSLPYYLGKFEYPMSVHHEQQIAFNNTSNEKDIAELRATENIELGKTLLFFPGQDFPKAEAQKPPQFVHKQLFTEINNNINVQQLPATDVKENFAELDQQQAQGYQHQVTVQHSGETSGYINQPPTEITKIIDRPYPVKVPYEVPYPVVKQVQVPVTVQKIIEKPVHVTKYIEKPVPIPQPYPVERIVEKPVHIPVQVTKYIDRPYPVEVRVPYPQPYPVEKVVQKIIRQPYPVEVKVPVPVDRIVEKKVPVTHYVEKPVEKIVEKPIPHFVDRPYPVEVKVPVPQPYLIRVEVPKHYTPQTNKLVQNPYGASQVPQASNVQAYTVATAVNVPQNLFTLPFNIYSQTNTPKKNIEQHAQQSQQQPYFYANPYAYAPQVNYYLPPKQEITLNNGYLPVAQNSNHLPPKKDCDQQNLDSNLRNFYYKIKPDDYIGLLPPKTSNSQLKYLRKFRTARSNFDEKNIRMEYGFMPPLIPSLEIDEQGNPIDKGDK